MVIERAAADARKPVPSQDRLRFERWAEGPFAYAALMRDEYPPFRLDMGGTDPGHQPAAPPAPAPDRSGELIGSR